MNRLFGGQSLSIEPQQVGKLTSVTSIGFLFGWFFRMRQIAA